jgi:3-deoxy-manno-octulosonate cytidylyltransferase (CMP-KDO synthetase)
MKTLVVIPARLASTRLPRKLLLAETGKPLIAHVIDRACEATAPDDIVIAAPNEDAADIWVAAGESAHFSRERRWPTVVHTAQHPNGTSRAAQVALFADQIGERPDGWWEAYCIVQANEPEIDPKLIDQVCHALDAHQDWDCATAAVTEAGDGNPNKVWVSVRNGVALDFARGRKIIDSLVADKVPGKTVFRHVGIYAYRRNALRRYSDGGPCQREQDESLEQLGALHVGLKMGVVFWEGDCHGGIHTPEDYKAFVVRWKAGQP